MNISLVFIIKSYFPVPRNNKLNLTHYFILKISNKCELLQATTDHSYVADFQGFANLYKKCTVKPYSFLAMDTTLASDSYSHFRKNHLERI